MHCTLCRARVICEAKLSSLLAAHRLHVVLFYSMRSKIIFFARCASFARSAFLFYRMTRLRGISYRMKKTVAFGKCSPKTTVFFLCLFSIQFKSFYGCHGTRKRSHNYCNHSHSHLFHFSYLFSCFL